MIFSDQSQLHFKNDFAPLRRSFGIVGLSRKRQINKIRQGYILKLDKRICQNFCKDVLIFLPLFLDNTGYILRFY